MMNWLKKRFKNEKGLTLVELLAVIVILAIVGTIAFVSIGKIIENSKKDAFASDALRMIDAAKLYEANGNEIGDEGVKLETLISEGLIDEFLDPWEKDDVETGSVEKDDEGYKVTIKGGGHEISSVDEKTLQKGERDDIFGSDS